jgi:hypothetical protein
MKTISTMIAAALLIGVSFASVSSRAQPIAACTDAELGKLEASAGKMTDATKKAAVMKHISAARAQLRAQKLENCLIAMREAQTALSGG